MVSQDLTIAGDRNDDGIGVTIDGNGADRVLEISGGRTEVTLTDLTITRGSPAGSGGGILVDASNVLKLRRCTISQNSTPGDRLGGGSAAQSSLTMAAI